jgi:dimethylamine/trimethylamine dehydrogenase
VDISLESEITPDDALGHGFTDILVATGARWRNDGVGRWHTSAIRIDADASILTPDDLLTGDHPLQRPGTAPQRRVRKAGSSRGTGYPGAART